MAKGDIGGQAVLEGVMLKAPKKMAIAVRKSDGSIFTETYNYRSVKEKYGIFKLPVLRGIVAFVEAMTFGVKSITTSAKLFEDESEQEKSAPSGFEKFISEKTGKSIDDVIMMLTVAFALVFAIFLFIILPTIVVGFLRGLGLSGLTLNVLEGILRLSIFIGYVVLISRMKEIRRVFQFHGAEHKTIHCYENGEFVCVDNARKYTTLHPRCGTAFLLFVMVISIAAFSLIEWGNLFVRIVGRLALLPIVAGISYELVRFAGKSESPIVKIIMLPGLLLQKLTTKEPDDLQLEVAVCAFNALHVKEAVLEKQERTDEASAFGSANA